MRDAATTNETRHQAHDLWQLAASFAARAHLGASRKDGATPYVAHPFRVAITIRHVFECDDPVCLAAALLHDVIEDTEADYDDVEELCGHDVAAIVAALTKDMRLPEAEREPAYDQQLAAADWRARLVKLGDVYDNLSDGVQTDITLRSTLKKAERAIVLAEPDADDHPVIGRAISAVRTLVERTTD